VTIATQTKFTFLVSRRHAHFINIMIATTGNFNPNLSNKPSLINLTIFSLMKNPFLFKCIKLDFTKTKPGMNNGNVSRVANFS
jgi:hypothetical protein